MMTKNFMDKLNLSHPICSSVGGGGEGWCAMDSVDSILLCERALCHAKLYQTCFKTIPNEAIT